MAKLDDLISDKLLYNIDGDDSVRTIIGGNPTNVFDLYNVKYQWAYDIYTRQLQNHWIPEKVSMIGDKQSYNTLTEHERTAFLKILSFLIFLDSIQTNNLPNIQDYITAPEVVLSLSRQGFEESLHSRSYGHILTSIFDKKTAEEAIYYWRKDEILRNRNTYIANIYSDFINKRTIRNFIRVVIANYLLEGIYFYNGFMFFYNLGSRGMMTNTMTQIKYINRDEILHCMLFTNIIKALKVEIPDLMREMEPEIIEMVKTACKQEYDFSCHVIGDNILGMNTESIQEYCNYLGNLRLWAIGYPEVFPKSKNPYTHLETLASVEDESTSKTNIFEEQSIAYKQATSIEGWDDI